MSTEPRLMRYLQNLCLELATMGDLKLVERPQNYTLGPGAQQAIRCARRRAQTQYTLSGGLRITKLWKPDHGSSTSYACQLRLPLPCFVCEQLAAAQHLRRILRHILYFHSSSAYPLRRSCAGCMGTFLMLVRCSALGASQARWPLMPCPCRANIKVSSTETGAIFGNIVYEATGYADRSVVVLNDIHIDIMDYISPAACADVAFRSMWAEFEWENKARPRPAHGPSPVA